MSVQELNGQNSRSKTLGLLCHVDFLEVGELLCSVSQVLVTQESKVFSHVEHLGSLLVIFEVVLAHVIVAVRQQGLV